MGNDAGVKGNQVRVLSDSVTVNGEKSCASSIVLYGMRRSDGLLIRKSGNLLKMLVHSFRRKPDAIMSLQGFFSDRENRFTMRLLCREADAFVLYIQKRNG